MILLGIIVFYGESMMSRYDDPEYKRNVYQKLLDNWDERFKTSWKSSRRYWDDNKLQKYQIDNFAKSSDIAKRIYVTLNTECNPFEYTEMFNYLAKRTQEELQYAEKTLPEFMAFLDNSNMDKSQKLKLKTVYPHIAGSFFQLCNDNSKISFTEFMTPFNNILQTLEQQNSYYTPTAIFDNCLSDYYETNLDKKTLMMKLAILKETVKHTTRCGIINNIQGDFDTYRKVFPETVNNQFLSNYIQFIIPRAIKQDDIFGRQNNKWGCGVGKGVAKGVGAATFAYKSYATPINPRGINDLLQMSYEVLGGDLAKHEQIREDALLLNSWFARDPIHDSTPGVNEIIEKMVAYYDAEPNNKERALQDLMKINEKVNCWSRFDIYTLSKYDEVSPKSQEPHIDILRRINQNMSKNDTTVPTTENDALNEKANNVAKKTPPSLEDIMPLVTTLNQGMLSAIDKKQTGFSPEMVRLIAWTDKKLSVVLNNMDFEYQSGFYKSNNCKEILMFSELVHSPKETFDVKEFNDFYEQQIINAFDMEEAYKNIANRQNNNLFALYEQYDKDCQAMDNTAGAKIITDARKERAGSGNTLKALQNLTLYKEASTIIGKKSRAEKISRNPYREVMLREYYKAR